MDRKAQLKSEISQLKLKLANPEIHYERVNEINQTIREKMLEVDSLQAGTIQSPTTALGSSNQSVSPRKRRVGYGISNDANQGGGR